LKLTVKKILGIILLSLILGVPLVIYSFHVAYTTTRTINFNGQPTTLGLAVSSDSSPIQDPTWYTEGYSNSYDTAQDWIGKTIRTVKVITNQSYSLPGDIFGGFFSGSISEWENVNKYCVRMLAALGIRAVENPPYDAELTITITSKEFGDYYVPAKSGSGWDDNAYSYSQGNIYRSSDARFFANGASSGAVLLLSAPGFQTLRILGGAKTSLPGHVEGQASITDIPFNKAIAEAIVEAFTKTWGNKALAYSLTDPYQPILYGGVAIAREVYLVQGLKPIDVGVLANLQRLSQGNDFQLKVEVDSILTAGS
jgi:hypothetical protein